ncbi:MAG: glycosyl hydrolase 115 family protein [Terriglobia bacterium]
MKTLILSLLALTVAFGAQALGSSGQPSAPKAQDEPLRIDSTLTILLVPHTPSPVMAATQDLASDFEKVLGKKPTIINRVEDAAPVTILIGEQSDLPANMRPPGLTDPESFEISVTRADWKPPTKVVLLAGADMRGTIYAIYEFAEEYLGIDPLYYWTDHQPAKRTQIALPGSLEKRFPSPVFKHRGFFINDEDLLTGWAPGGKDGTGISLAVWNKIFETILRLKGDMVTPGTWIFSDEPQVKLAAQRGLIITQHHAIPLGMNVARWPKDVPYNYTTHPEIVERAWKNAMREYPPGAEVIWTVGLRGLSDITYASMDPSVRGDNKALGHLISKAIADQMQIVRSIHPDAQFITSLWMEGARLVQQGDLTIPSEVSTVWADDGYGYLQDKGQAAKGEGAYYHVAVMNGRANQLSEMVPVERIFSELGRYINAGATQYLLLNTSDIRPVPLTAKAVMDVAWKGVPSAGPEAADDYIRTWSRAEFGAPAASKVAEVYKEYFRAPAHFGDPAHEYGDQIYHTEARQMMLTYMISPPLYALPSQSPPWSPPHIFGMGAYEGGMGNGWLPQTIEREIKQCGDAQPRWDALWKKALAAEPLVAVERRPFYHAHVLAMVAINCESNRMLLEVAKAIQEAQSGKTGEARQAAMQGLGALDEINKAEMAAEYGQWKNWYRGDWLTGVYRTHQMLAVFSQYLTDHLTHLPPPVFWDGWEAYYHIMNYQGDRSADVK